MSVDCVDLQVNGCFGIDFNSDTLTEEQVVEACAKMRAHGTGTFLATLITDELPLVLARIRRIAEVREANPIVRETIVGIHVEGPFLNPSPGFAGAHPAEHMRPASVAVVDQILDAGRGSIRMVTLAPEQDPEGVAIRRCVDDGIVVAAGHTDATLDQLRRSVDAGLSLFTHLGNGCPRLVDRHDNIIQRVLHLRDQLHCTLIADGLHLPWFVLHNFLSVFGADRTIIVSDATAAAEMPPGTYRLGRHVIERPPASAPRKPGDCAYLAGSATLLPEMARRLRDVLNLDEPTVVRLVSSNAKRLLGLP